MNGLALTILVGQLPKLFGFSVDADGFIDELAGFFRGVADGETVTAALAIGALGLVLIVVLQRVCCPSSPACCVVVVVSIALAAIFDLADPGRVAGRRAAAGVPAVHDPDGVARRPGRARRSARSASRWCR